MAFQFNNIGPRIASDPSGAHALIAEQFNRCDNSTGAVARQLGVNVSTLRRWIARLVEAGFKDPSGGERAGRGKDVRPRLLRKAKKKSTRPASKKASR